MTRVSVIYLPTSAAAELRHGHIEAAVEDKLFIRLDDIGDGGYRVARTEAERGSTWEFCADPAACAAMLAAYLLTQSAPDA